LETCFKDESIVAVGDQGHLMELLVPPPSVSESSLKVKKRITLLIPIGMPGIGKTTFTERILSSYFTSHLRDQQIDFKMVSNDETRQQLIEEYMKANKDVDRDQVFLKTGSKVHERVHEILRETVETMTSESGEAIENQVIYLDKNYPPTILMRLINFMHEIEDENENISIQKTCLIPKVIAPHTIEDCKYPFSLQLLLTCYQRVLNRHHHMTLTNEQPELVSRVLFGFFHSFKNICFDDEFKKMFDIDSFLEVNLSGESASIQLPQNIVTVMNRCLLKC
jgi:adenylate kinase family enzyme